MKISIIIPAYNSSRYIGACISSLVSQNFKNIEIIVIDDGSTDNTKDVIKSFSDSRIKYIFKKHEGTNIARGIGVRNATGQYCMFIDADDWVETNAAEKVATVAEATGADSIKFNGIVEPSGQLKNIYNLGKPQKEISPEEVDRILLETNILNNLCFSAYKTDLLKVLKSFDKKLSNCEDLFVNLEFYETPRKVIFIKDTLYHYRRNSYSTTNSQEPEVLIKGVNDQLLVFDRLLNLAMGKSINQKNIANRIAIMLKYAMRNIVCSGNIYRNTYFETVEKVKNSSSFTFAKKHASRKNIPKFRLTWTMRDAIRKYRRKNSKTISKYIRGRLGNQLFQYASARQLQETSGGDVELVFNFSRYVNSLDFQDDLKNFNVVPYKTSNKIRLTLPQIFYIYLHKVIKRIYRFINPTKYKEFRYIFENRNANRLQRVGIYWKEDGALEMRCANAKHKIMIGHFESAKNFDKIRDQLLFELTPKNKPLEKNKDLYKIIKDNESVCISIRRGDFVSNPKFSKNFNVCDMNYFNMAIREIRKHVKNPTFIVFSDDVDWCKHNVKIASGEVYFEDGTDPVWEKLRLMYSCKHFIISNSTFSWWAQYLSRNNDKIVIAPKKWTNFGYDRDIYEKNWILIDNSGRGNG